MPSDSGNAVIARWVGPSGHQLFDGTGLDPGVVVQGIGKDEAEGNPYWEVLGDLDEGTEIATDASTARDDWSFGTEEGGDGTGRPLNEAQLQADKDSRAAARAAKKSASDAPPPPETAPEGETA